MEAERNCIVKFLSDNEKMKSLLHFKELRQNVNRAELSSENLRARGNELYLRKDHDALNHQLILRMYSKSIATAPPDSEQLAYSYADRSMFLYHVGQNEESIQDIDRALEIIHTEPLRRKLVDRRSMIVKNLLSQTCEKLGKAMTLDTEGKDNEKEREDGNLRGRNEEITDVFNSVDIQYTKEHGRMLVAKKNFAPGEIVFTEVIYSKCVNPEKFYSHCSNCLKFSWATIPCHDCDWSMFCSEKCRVEAMKNYHDIECPVISSMKNVYANFIQNYQIPIKTLIMAIKKAGSIEKMKERMELVDRSTDVCWRGFKSDEVFIEDEFIHLYSLSSKPNLPTLLGENFDAISILILITLAEKSNIFGRKFKLTEITEFIDYPDVIFIGALILKLLEIHVNYTYTIQNHLKECTFTGDPDLCQIANCCARGKCLTPVSALINHSCYPNVSRCFTDDGKLMIYAIHPIKKNTEILGCYYSSFCMRPIDARQEFLDSYGFACDCSACKNDWPPIVALCEESQDEIATKCNPLELKIYQKGKKIIVTGKNQPDVNEEDAIQNLSIYIVEASEIVQPPSILLCYLTKSLEYYFTTKYNYKDEDIGPCVAFKSRWNWHER